MIRILVEFCLFVGVFVGSSNAFFTVSPSIRYFPSYVSRNRYRQHDSGGTQLRMDYSDEDDDDEAPSVDTSNFVPPKSISYGLNRGRSAPSQRKAMGTSGAGSTSVHVCTNCGSEFVKWMGRCPTCREWNTLQEFRVDRGVQAQPGRPTFSSSRRPTSWLDGTQGDGGFVNQPVRVTDVYKEIVPPSDAKDHQGDFAQRERRIRVPDDEEFNNVMGGGIMSGSLTLLGGDPGVGKVRKSTVCTFQVLLAPSAHNSLSFLFCT